MVALERGATLVTIEEDYAFEEDDITERAVKDVAEAMRMKVTDYLTYLDREGRDILKRLT